MSNYLEFLVFALVKSTFDWKIEIYIICIIGKQHNNISKMCMLPHKSCLILSASLYIYTPGYSIIVYTQSFNNSNTYLYRCPEIETLFWPQTMYTIL